MKNLKLFIIAFAVITLSVINTATAQNYKSQFHINSTGEIENNNGVKLGKIEADGTIKNPQGEVVGKVHKNEFHNNLGKKMGSVSEDGTFTGGNGKVLYKISVADENGICKILDPKGNVVGTVHQNYKQQGACAFHCLNKKK